jgi:hypothetical protein
VRTGSTEHLAAARAVTDPGLAHPTAPPTPGVLVKKKVRAAAVLALVTTAVSQARDYAREHPGEAGAAVDKVEQFLRGRLAPRHGAHLDRGGAALRQGLGLPARDASQASAPVGAGTGTDPDPDTTEPPQRHEADDPVAPNPSPGTSDDPQPRRGDDEPAPLTPGERPRS